MTQRAMLVGIFIPGKTDKSKNKDQPKIINQLLGDSSGAEENRYEKMDLFPGCSFCTTNRAVL